MLAGVAVPGTANVDANVNAGRTGYANPLHEVMLHSVAFADADTIADSTGTDTTTGVISKCH